MKKINYETPMKQMLEVPLPDYDDISGFMEMPEEGEGSLEDLRKTYQSNCLMLAIDLKGSINASGMLAEIVTFKNGNAFLDGGIVVFGKKYTHHSVVLMGEWVIDLLHTTKVISTKDYIEMLEKDNPELRLDCSMTTCWYDDEGYPIMPTIESLKHYRMPQN